MTGPANRPSAEGPRRWPDLLIGLLVLLLLGGFGALLLKPRPTTVTTTAAPTPAATTVPAAPTTEASAPVTPPAPADTVTTPTTTPSTDTPTTNTTTEPPVIAAQPIQTQPATPATVTAPPSTDTLPPSTQTASEAPPPPPPPPPRGAVPTSETRVPLRSDYRISLGVFSTARTVRTQTAAVSTLGYTVYPIDLGTQFVAQVGPFADAASAQQALADIQRTYPGAALLAPRGRPAPTTGAGNTTPASTSASTTASTPAPAPDGPTYLQVGAFDRVESAQKLVQQLRDLGYTPTVNAPDGRKVTVAVGPFTGSALTRTETRLSANGLDHFRVR